MPLNNTISDCLIKWNIYLHAAGIKKLKLLNKLIDVDYAHNQI